MRRRGVPAQIGLAIAILLVAALMAAYCTPDEDPQPLQPSNPGEATTEETTQPSEQTELPPTGGVGA